MYKPVIKGMCRYESLIDGTIHIEDIRRMNDAIAVNEDNDILMREYVERNQK